MTAEPSGAPVPEAGKCHLVDNEEKDPPQKKTKDDVKDDVA